MKTFLAIVLNKIKVADNTLYEENFVEIKATSLSKANEFIKEYAKKQNFDYKNVDGQLVKNRFYKIIDVNEVLFEKPENHVRELYSRHFKNIEAYKKIENLLKK